MRRKTFVTNVKVDRLLLIKALEAEQKKQTEQFKRDMVHFKAAEKLYPKSLATVLNGLANRASSGKAFELGYNGEPKISLPKRPVKPSKNGTVCVLQRQIQTLKMSKSETITVNENSEYVKFICEL